MTRLSAAVATLSKRAQEKPANCTCSTIMAYPFGRSISRPHTAAPTLANIDGDPDLEVILNTAHSGVVAYDLPGSAIARILWATGRGTLRRSGGITVIPSTPAPSDPPNNLPRRITQAATLIPGAAPGVVFFAPSDRKNVNLHLLPSPDSWLHGYDYFTPMKISISPVNDHANVFPETQNQWTVFVFKCYLDWLDHLKTAPVTSTPKPNRQISNSHGLDPCAKIASPWVGFHSSKKFS
jgi:hypothetical protein